LKKSGCDEKYFSQKKLLGKAGNSENSFDKKRQYGIIHMSLIVIQNKNLRERGT
jgi:hypothetical protein